LDQGPTVTSIISQVTPSESSPIKRIGMEPLFLDVLRDTLGIKRGRATLRLGPASRGHRKVKPRSIRNRSARTDLPEHRCSRALGRCSRRKAANTGVVAAEQRCSAACSCRAPLTLQFP
jgi:hypothetical protein